MAKRKKIEEMTKPQLAEILWKHFSKFIRLRDCGGIKQWGECISCGSPIQEGTNNCQAGHYYPRIGIFLAIKFDEDNVHGQCYQCNHQLQGNQVEYKPRLIVKIGRDNFDRISNIKRDGLNWSKSDYIEKINYYKEKVKEFENAL